MPQVNVSTMPDGTFALLGYSPKTTPLSPWLTPHDAIRKTVTAHMAAVGLRVRSGDGAHRITLDYARNQLAGIVEHDDLVEADEIRKDRALAEYGDFASRKLNAAHVRTAADVAERFVDAVAAALAALQSPRDRTS